MNVLPLILFLLVLLSILTTHQMENFRRLSIIQKEYQDYLDYQEREDWDKHQRNLYDAEEYYHTRRLNFRPFFNEEAKGKIPDNQWESFYTLTKDLMRVLYSHTDFFQEMEKKRPDFLDNILDAILKESKEFAESADPKDKNHFLKGRIENLAQVNLKDPELQDVFYRMLKGTVKRQDMEQIAQLGSTEYNKKSYVSLFYFIRDKANINFKDQPHKIPIYSAPKELLTAIYGDMATVQDILDHRKDYRAKKAEEVPAKSIEFTSFMMGKEVRSEVKAFLDYTVSTTDPTNYD